MAAFGEQNYATPLGAISASEFFNSQGSGFYDYSGFSSRSGVLGFSGNAGISGFSAFCGLNGIEFIPYRPTLTFPLNFEILQGVVGVTWKEAAPVDPCNDQVSYELQFTRTFSLDVGWKTISADIPAGTNSFAFDVSQIPFTQDAGLRIRARDSRNLHSNWSQSSQAFTISNHAPNTVTVLSISPHEEFDYCIPVLWQEPDVGDVDGHPVMYLVEITDKFSSGTGWVAVPGADSLPQGTTNFNISSFDFPEGADYGVRVSTVDSAGLASAPSVAGPFSIVHQGNFIVDTVPPQGSIAINDGAVLAASTKVKITLFAFDETTGVKDVRFRNAEEDCFGDFDTFAPEKFWDLPKSDGVKTVFVQFRDFADNLSEACDCEIVSRVLCDEGDVTDIEVFNNKLYVAFDAKGNLVEYRTLVRRAAAVPQPEITALARFGNFLYLAAFDPQTGASSVYSFDGTAVLAFSIAGAKILTMQSYNGILFLGLDNGKIMSYDGSVAISVFAAAAAISRLRTDGAVLFATVQGTGVFLSTIDGVTWKSNLL